MSNRPVLQVVTSPHVGQLEPFDCFPVFFDGEAVLDYGSQCDVTTMPANAWNNGQLWLRSGESQVSSLEQMLKKHITGRLRIWAMVKRSSLGLRTT